MEDFFGKLSLPGEDTADDFEKEAAEGFAMLEDREEALRLKAQLDKEIYNSTFAGKQPGSHRAYWLAAAGLFLIIGLSIYFIQYIISPVNEKGLAVHNPSVQDAPPPTEALISEKPGDVPGRETFKAPASPPATKNKPSAGAGLATPEKDPAPGTSPGKNPEEPEAAVRSSPEQFNTQAAGSPAEQNQVTDQAESSGKNAERVIEPERTASTKKMSVAKDDMVNSPGAAEVRENKKSKSRSREQPAVQNEDGRFATTSADEIQSGAAEVPAFILCDYRGKEEGFNKDLKTKLADKNSGQPFDGTLFIGADRTVKKVKLTKTGSLTAEQQQQIIAVLKTMDRFVLTVQPRETDLVEYKFSYKP